MCRHICTNIRIVNKEPHFSYKQYSWNKRNKGWAAKMCPHIFFFVLVHFSLQRLHAIAGIYFSCHRRYPDSIYTECCPHCLSCISRPQNIECHVSHVCSVRFVAAEVSHTTSACYNRVYLFTYTSHFFAAPTNAVGLLIPVISWSCPFSSVCIVAMLHRECS